MTWKEFNEYLDQYPEFFQEMDGCWVFVDCKGVYHWVCSYDFNEHYIPIKVSLWCDEEEDIYETYEIDIDKEFGDDSEIVNLEIGHLEEFCKDLVCHIKEINCQIKKEEMEQDFV